MMTRNCMLGALVALSAAAVAQPAAAQWYDRGDGFGVSVGIGAAPAYGYAAYGPGCTCPPAGYAGYAYGGGSPSAYSSYGYAAYPSTEYSYSYSSYEYPRYGYASVGIGVTDQSVRGSRFVRERAYRDQAALRDREIVGVRQNREVGVRRNGARSEVAVDSQTRIQARGALVGENRSRVRGSAAAQNGRGALPGGSAQAAASSNVRTGR